MALFARDPDQILSDALQYVTDNTSINATTPGSKFRTLVDVLKQYLGEAYLTFDFNTAISLVYGARGKYLDYLGDLFNMQRGQIVSATVDLTHQNLKFYVNSGTFGTINGNQDIVIPSGTQIWAQRNGQNVYYVLSDTTTLLKTNSYQYVSADAMSSGAFGNVSASSIVYHSFTTYTDNANNSLLITNIDTIDSGVDSESDDNYRYRILNARLSEISANKTAIMMAVLGVNGVADAVIFDKYYGIGTSSVMVKSTTPTVSDDLLARVQVAIDNVKAEGVDIIAMKPRYIYLKFVITPTYISNVTTSDIVNIKSNIITTVTNFVNNLDIGEDFSINALVNNILLNNVQVKTIGKPNKFFDRIYSIKSLSGGQQIVNELLNDLSVDQFTKIIISTDNDNVVVNNVNS